MSFLLSFRFLARRATVAIVVLGNVAFVANTFAQAGEGPAGVPEERKDPGPSHGIPDGDPPAGVEEDQPTGVEPSAGETRAGVEERPTRGPHAAGESPAGVADPSRPLVGEWKTSMDFAGTETVSTSRFWEEEGELKGEINFGPMKLEATDVTIKGDAVTWSVVVPQFGGQALTAEARLTGDTMEGSYDAPIGKITFKSKRAKSSEPSGADTPEAMAGDPKTGVESALGTWELEVDVMGQAHTGVLIVSEQDDGLHAKMEYFQGAFEADSVSIEDGTLRWEFRVSQLGPEPLIGEATIDGDNFDGVIAAPIGDLPVTGVRAGAAKPGPGDPEDLLGDWVLSAEFGGQPVEIGAEIAEEEDELTLNLDTDFGAMKGYDLRYTEDGKLTWKMDVPQFSPEPLNAEATVAEGTLEGNIGTPMGPIAFEGKRAPENPFAPVLGKWDVTTRYNGRENTSTVLFELEEDKLKAVYTGDLGVIQAEDVSFQDGTASWAIPIPQLGEDPLKAEVTVRDGRMEGQYTSPLGTIAILGERAAPVSDVF